MPSKALLRPADVLAEARRVPGVPARRAASSTPQAILARRDEVIHDLDDSGPAALAGRTRDRPLPRRRPASTASAGCAVGDEVLDARARRSSSPPAAAPRCRRSTASTRSRPGTTARRTTAKQVPESMIVLGGGPVGSELSQAWASLGHQGDPGRGRRAPALPRGAVRRRGSRRRRCASSFGVDVRTGVQAERVEAGGAGVDRRARRRQPRRGRRDPDRGRPRPPHRRARPRLGRGRAGRARLPRDRRPPAGRRPRVALRDRRRQRPRPLHPHGQVPGLGRGREPARPRGRGRSPKGSARPGSPSPTRRSPRSARPSTQAREAGIDARAVDVPTDGTAGASFQGKDTGGTSRIVVDQAKRDDRRRHLHRLRDRRLPPGRDGRDRRRGAARATCATRSPPTPPAARSG